MSKMDEERIVQCFQALSRFRLSDDVTARDLERVKQRLTEYTSEQKRERRDMWRIIMRRPVTKIAAAVAVIVSVVVGIHFLGGPTESRAWGELVERVQQSHDEYLEQLLLAVESKDTEKIAFYADMLSEFWQKLHWLTREAMKPESQAQLIARVQAGYENRKESDRVGIEIFLEHADKFTDWLGKVEDVAWIQETTYVCKQMEEYLEEIRDGARSLELGLSYVEHCLPSCVAYARWFELLPWNDPGQYMMPDTLLRAIKRDLEVAHREILRQQIRDAERFAQRCVQQADKNASELVDRIDSQPIEDEGQKRICRKLGQKSRGKKT